MLAEPAARPNGVPPASIRERCSIRGLFGQLRRSGAAVDQRHVVCCLLRHRDGRLGPPGLGAFRDNLAADDVAERSSGSRTAWKRWPADRTWKWWPPPTRGRRGRCPRWCRSATGRRAGRGDGPPWIAAAWPAAVRTISRNTPTSFHSILADIEFDVVGGDARISDRRILAVDSPTVGRMVLHCQLPAYIGRQSPSLPVTGVMQVPMGSRLTVEATEANKELVRVDVGTMVGDRIEPTAVLVGQASGLPEQIGNLPHVAAADWQTGPRRVGRRPPRLYLPAGPAVERYDVAVFTDRHRRDYRPRSGGAGLGSDSRPAAAGSGPA